ncbi:MAG: hypothetical protein KA369_21205 [Spirochaetes bacterium]|nr:hypothetical protein [Spirochaetota bacterium]
MQAAKKNIIIRLFLFVFIGMTVLYYRDSFSESIPNPVQPTVVVSVQDQDTTVFFQGQRAGHLNKKKSKRVEAFKIGTAVFSEDQLGFEYSAVSEGKGKNEVMTRCTSQQDKENTRKGCWAGNVKDGKKMYRFSINLTGSMKDKYAVIYGGHWEDAGDMGPFMNGQVAGPTGHLRLQAIWVWIVTRETLSGNPDMLQTIWNSRANKYDNVKKKFTD